jgi:hypothetical protein
MWRKWKRKAEKDRTNSRPRGVLFPDRPEGFQIPEHWRVWRDAPVNTIAPDPLAILQPAIRRKPSGTLTGKLPCYLVEGEAATGENSALKNNFLDHASPFALRSVERKSRCVLCHSSKVRKLGHDLSESRVSRARSKSGAEAMRRALARFSRPISENCPVPVGKRQMIRSSSFPSQVWAVVER